MIYQVIDLLDGEIVFEGKTKECINYVLNHGPSYDIIPKIVPDATIGVERSFAACMLLGILFWVLIFKLIF